MHQSVPSQAQRRQWRKSAGLSPEPHLIRLEFIGAHYRYACGDLVAMARTMPEALPMMCLAMVKAGLTGDAEVYGPNGHHWQTVRDIAAVSPGPTWNHGIAERPGAATEALRLHRKSWDEAWERGAKSKAYKRPRWQKRLAAQAAPPLGFS